MKGKFNPRTKYMSIELTDIPLKYCGIPFSEVFEVKIKRIKGGALK